MMKKLFLFAAMCFVSMQAEVLAQDVYPLTEDQLAACIAAQAQITDVPTLYLTIPDVTNLDNDLSKDRNTGEASYHAATIKVVDKNGRLKEFEDAKLEIKVRGNSTADPSKRAYRLKFGKDEKDKTTGTVTVSHKHDLMGGGYKKRNWALLANCFDHSLIRNALTCELGKLVGMPFNPGYCFVDLVINDDYRGTYQVSDHVEIGKNRIDIDEDNDWYVEFQGRQDMLDEPYLQVSGCPMFSIKNPDYSDEADADKLSALKEEMTTWIKNWSSAFSWDASITQSDTKGWRAYNDEDQLLKWILETEITADYDGYMTIKAYRSLPDGKLMWGPVWDKDLAWDNYGDYTNTLAASIGSSSIKYNVYNNGSSNSLFADPRFVKRIYEEYNKLLDNGLEATLLQKVDELHQMVVNTQAQNFQKWGITNVYGGLEKYHEWTDYAQYPEQLKTFITERLSYLKSEFASIYNNVCAIETASYNPENAWWGTGLTVGKYLNQTVENRTYQAGEWNTFCLPFSVTREKLKSVFGEDVQVANHYRMAKDSLTLLFAPYEGDVQAGVPYLLKPSATVSNPVFPEVVNTANANQNDAYNGEGVSHDGGKHSFFGTLFLGYNVNASTDYLFADDVYKDAASLQKATSNSVKGARAFVRVPEGEKAQVRILTAEEVKQLEDEATAIQTIEGEYMTAKTVSGVYNLNGQYIGSSTSLLPHGVYIVNGRKIIR